jgi:hypothetical protein
MALGQRVSIPQHNVRYVTLIIARMILGCAQAIDDQRFFTSWLSDVAPVRLSKVSSFMSLRAPAANLSP